MPCGGCYGARQQLYSSVRRLDMRGAVAAVQRGVMINVDKARGLDPNARYSAPVVKAPPYKRPPDIERSA